MAALPKTARASGTRCWPTAAQRAAGMAGRRPTHQWSGGRLLAHRRCTLVGQSHGTTWWRWAGHSGRLRKKEPWRWRARVGVWQEVWWRKALRELHLTLADPGRIRFGRGHRHFGKRPWGEVVQRHVLGNERSPIWLLVPRVSCGAVSASVQPRVVACLHTPRVPGDLFLPGAQDFRPAHSHICSTSHSPVAGCSCTPVVLRASVSAPARWAPCMVAPAGCANDGSPGPAEAA